jgi:hypothetical protein
MDFFDVLEYWQIEAIKLALKQDAQYVWRRKCREYSQMFNTPLHEVYKLDTDFVLQNLSEATYNTEHVHENIDEILDVLRKTKDPTYEKFEQEEIEDLVDMVINKENKRKTKMNQEVSLPGKMPVEPKVVKDLPKKGGISFKELAEKESEELGKDGFKD